MHLWQRIVAVGMGSASSENRYAKLPHCSHYDAAPPRPALEGGLQAHR